MVEWTMAESPSLSITLDGRPDLLAVRLKELYGITGRSSDALRRAIAAGEPIYSAALFGNDHIDVAPRLEKTIAFCERHGLGFRIEETYDGATEEIGVDVMRDILKSAEGHA